MAASQVQTHAAPEWLETWHRSSQAKQFTRVRAAGGAPKHTGEEAFELLQSCLQNIWVYLSFLTLFIPLGVADLRAYCIPLALILLLISLSVGSLSLIRRLRLEIAQLSAPLVYDAAVGEIVRRMLSKFNAKERAVLRALTVCEPWNRWKHLPEVEVQLHEQFEILYKALQEHLLIEVDEDEFVRFVPQYLEPAKAMLFENVNVDRITRAHRIPHEF